MTELDNFSVFICLSRKYFIWKPYQSGFSEIECNKSRVVYWKTRAKIVLSSLKWRKVKLKGTLHYAIVIKKDYLTF